MIDDVRPRDEARRREYPARRLTSPRTGSIVSSGNSARSSPLDPEQVVFGVIDQRQRRRLAGRELPASSEPTVPPAPVISSAGP